VTTAQVEAAAIWTALFGGNVPERVADRYAAAIARLPLEPNPIAGTELLRSPRRLAAVEFYLRLSQRKNGLSQRFHVLFYLAEIEPQLFPRFARERSSMFLACVDLILAVLAAPLVWLAGSWWWWRRARSV